MITFDSFYQAAQTTSLERWIPSIQSALEKHFFSKQHGELAQWLQWIDEFPSIKSDSVQLNNSTVTVGSRSELEPSQSEKFETQLRQFMPWRKGPFSLFGVEINTEWRSDMKWDRLISHITPLENRLILDVGCGSGYHCWRMTGENAKMVIGIDPSQFFMMQYQTIRHFMASPPEFYFLPLTLDQLPQPMKVFDTVFSMGVLYHRRSPIDHLFELRHCLRPGGELVLETLVVDGEEGYSLIPESTYGKMSNVWFIPTCKSLQSWLLRCGFNNIKIVDVAQTSVVEQRKTNWISGHSLQDFLDPNDHSKTIEGYPAPQRAVVVATAP